MAGAGLGRVITYDDTMNTTQRNERSERRPERRSKVPTSGDGAPASDGEDTGRAAYEDLFGTPALEEDDSPGDVWGRPDAEPSTIPELRFTAFPPERALYRAAFRAAYKYPDALMVVMNGVRKGLERGQKAARRGGESR